MAEKKTDSGYNRPSTPLASFFGITILYLLLFPLFFWIAGYFGLSNVREVPIFDMVILAVATHKVAWLITKDLVLSFLRAPFASYQQMIGPGAATYEKPRGKGLQRALGDLLTCPWCVGQWIATLFVLSYVLLPQYTLLVATIFAVLMLSDFLHIFYIYAGKKMSA